MQPAAEKDQFDDKAILLVRRAKSSKGHPVTATYRNSPVRTFEDVLCEQIYTQYVEEATRIVDEGRWYDADREATEIIIGRTALILRNQT